MFCRNCGSEIDDRAVFCPHCGVATSNEMQPASGKTNTMSVVGLVLAFFFPIVGLVLSIIGLRQCREKGEGGRGLAIAGIVISILEIISAIVICIVYAIFIVGILNAAAGGATV